MARRIPARGFAEYGIGLRTRRRRGGRRGGEVEESVEKLRLRDAGGFAVVEEFAAAQGEDAVEALRESVEIVRRFENGSFFVAAPLRDSVVDRAATGEVEERGRFVENEKVGVLRERCGEKNAASFPAAEGVEASVGELERVDAFERFVGDGAILRAQEREGAKMGKTAQKDDLSRRRAAVRAAMLSEIRDAPREIVAGIAFDAASVEQDRARGRRDKTRDAAQKRRFTRAVASDERDPRIAFKREAHAAQKKRAASRRSVVEVFDSKERFRHAASPGS